MANTRNTNRNVTLTDALKKLHEDIESAPSYSAKINAYLRSNVVHSTHRRIVKKIFPRRRVIARFPFDIFMADLIDKILNNTSSLLATQTFNFEWPALRVTSMNVVMAGSTVINSPTPVA